MVWSLIIGLVAGAIAKFLMPGKDPGGIFITMILGVAGSFLANFVGTQMGWYATTEAAGLVASVIGAIVLLAIYRVVSGNKTIAHRH